MARQPRGLLPSKDSPVILALLASSLIGPRCGEQLRLNGRLLGGWEERPAMPGMCGSIWSMCCIPGLNEATAAMEARSRVFLSAMSKQALHFGLQNRPSPHPPSQTGSDWSHSRQRDVANRSQKAQKERGRRKLRAGNQENGLLDHCQVALSNRRSGKRAPSSG